MTLYETLRTDFIEGRARCDGIAALRFHGMLQGLVILLKAPAMPAAPPPSPHFPLSPSLRRDSEFVRLLANLVLLTHSELTHVC